MRRAKIACVNNSDPKMISLTQLQVVVARTITLRGGDTKTNLLEPSPPASAEAGIPGAAVAIYSHLSMDWRLSLYKLLLTLLVYWYTSLLAIEWTASFQCYAMRIALLYNIKCKRDNSVVIGSNYHVLSGLCKWPEGTRYTKKYIQNEHLHWFSSVQFGWGDPTHNEMQNFLSMR